MKEGSEQIVVISVKGGVVVDVVNPKDVIVEVRDYGAIDAVDPLEWSYDDDNEPYVKELYN